MDHPNSFSTMQFPLRLLIILASIFVAALQSHAQDSDSDIFGKRWTLTEIEQRGFTTNRPYIEFDRDQNRVSGSGGCNRFSGAFAIAGSSLKISRVVSTKRACLDAELQRGETTFLRLLETATRFEVHGETLRLFANDRPVLVLSDQASPPTEASSGSTDLSGTSWQLVKFQSSDGTTLMPDDKSKYTILFANTGRATVRIDCNRGSGPWKSEGANQLNFGPMVLTRATCPPGSLHDRIAKDLTAVRSYVIKDEHLFLSLMADGGIYEFELSGGSLAQKPQEEAHVTGTVNYRQRMALTPRAVVEVRLVDISRADAPSTTIAEQTIRPDGRQVPIPFYLAYDPARIDPRGRYTIQVRILDRNRLRFRNSQAYPVITLGQPNVVSVIVTPVSR